MNHEKGQINILRNDDSSRKLIETLITQHLGLAKKIEELNKQCLILLSVIKELRTPIKSCWTKQRKNNFWEHDCQRNGSVFLKKTIA